VCGEADRLRADLAARIARFAARLPDIARREDLELLEINPLVLIPKGRLIACDAKIISDDSAGFRHDPDDFPTSRMLEERAMTPLERSARDLGFQLVEMDGDIALATSGAGLGMMMIDLLAEQGLTAACFMDNLRGAPDETMAERLRIARTIAERPHIKAIVFLTVLSSRSLAERIDALLEWVAAEPLPKPLFVGIAAGHALVGSASQARAILLVPTATRASGNAPAGTAGRSGGEAASRRTGSEATRYQL
jgi:succinyl-CoA synthetase beta subunit